MVTVLRAWSGDQPAPEDVDALVTAVVSSQPDRAEDGARALGESLVVTIQEHLSTRSSQDDLDLFFETYGTCRLTPHHWVLTILQGLRGRGLDGTTAAPIVGQAVRRARSA